MHSAYQDRGIIKWSAFDALNGFNSMLNEMRYRLNKIDKPTLSEDDFTNFDRVIKMAIENDLEVTINYYEKGYSKITYGKIKNLDFNNKKIILATKEKILASDVLYVSLM